MKINQKPVICQLPRYHYDLYIGVGFADALCVSLSGGGAHQQGPSALGSMQFPLFIGSHRV